MKQLVQEFRGGRVYLAEVPEPLLHDRGALVRTCNSAVSPGTEKAVMEFAAASILGKAIERPDLVRQVARKLRNEGIVSTYRAAAARLDNPLPLGYSASGVVMEIGREIHGFQVGDRVACGGGGYACHAEVNYIPRNLIVKLPDSVSFEEGAFAALGAIALQGVRLAELSIGERVAVIGLGVIGLLAVQIIKAAGCMVIATDLRESRTKIAGELGADMVVVTDQGELEEAALEFSNGRGMDAVIITAATKSNAPLESAAAISRLKGKVVAVGDVSLNVPRRAFYPKELELKVSMSYGPGRYDPYYEEKGIDYPYPYVPFTEQRNMEAFLDLVASGKVNLKRLITHRRPIDEAERLYKDILENRGDFLGVVLTYKEVPQSKEPIRLDTRPVTTVKRKTVRIGLIGAGSFAKAIILPCLAKMGDVELVGVSTKTGLSCRAVADKYGFSYCTTRNEDILGDSGIDAVIIATRHNLHAGLVVEALEAGKHVFVEKPLATAEEDLKTIRDTHINSDKVLMVGFNRRFAPFAKRAKRAFEDSACALSMLYRVNAGNIPKEHWTQDSEEGGGRIIGEVCHFIDFLQFICGARPSGVFAITTMDGEEFDIVDNVSIAIDFADGSIGAISYFTHGHKLVPKEYIEIFGGGKTIIIDDFRKMRMASGNSYRRIKEQRGKGHKEEFRAFINGVLEGRMPIQFEEMVNSTLATFRVVDSLKIGMRMPVS
jgi:predicted dehydrogenase